MQPVVLGMCVIHHGLHVRAPGIPQLRYSQILYIVYMTGVKGNTTTTCIYIYNYTYMYMFVYMYSYQHMYIHVSRYKALLVYMYMCRYHMIGSNCYVMDVSP